MPRLNGTIDFDDVASAKAASASWWDEQDFDKVYIHGLGMYDFEPSVSGTPDDNTIIAVTSGYLVKIADYNAQLSIIAVTATGLIPDYTDKVIIKNGATAIMLAMPRNSERLSFSRAAGSTGAITLIVQTGKKIQSLNGTAGATTTIAAHSAAGAGVQVDFWLFDDIWYR